MIPTIFLSEVEKCILKRTDLYYTYFGEMVTDLLGPSLNL